MPVVMNGFKGHPVRINTELNGFFIIQVLTLHFGKQAIFFNRRTVPVKYKIIKINCFLLFNDTSLDKILGHLFNNFTVYTAHRINIRQYQAFNNFCLILQAVSAFILAIIFGQNNINDLITVFQGIFPALNRSPDKSPGSSGILLQLFLGGKQIDIIKLRTVGSRI